MATLELPEEDNGVIKLEEADGLAEVVTEGKETLSGLEEEWVLVLVKLIMENQQL